MQIQTKIRYLFSLMRMAITKKQKLTKVGKEVEKGALRTAGGNVKRCSSSGSTEVPQKVKNSTTR